MLVCNGVPRQDTPRHRVQPAHLLEEETASALDPLGLINGHNLPIHVADLPQSPSERLCQHIVGDHHDRGSGCGAGGAAGCRRLLRQSLNVREELAHARLPLRAWAVQHVNGKALGSVDAAWAR